MGWIFSVVIITAWLISAYRAGKAMQIMKKVISQLADQALKPEEAKQLKEELGIDE